MIQTKLIVDSIFNDGAIDYMINKFIKEHDNINVIAIHYSNTGNRPNALIVYEIENESSNKI